MIAPFAMFPKATTSGRVLSLSKALVDRGHNVSIVIPPYDNPSHSGKEYEIDGVHICNVKMSNLPLIKYVLVSFRLVRKALSFKPNVIHVFKPKGYSGLAAMFLILMRRFKLLNGVSIVLDTDDWEGRGGFYDFYLENSIYPRVMLDFFDFQERWIPRHSDAVTVASKTLEKRILEWGIPPKRVFHVPNAPHHISRFSRDGKYDISSLEKKYGLESFPVILLYTRFQEYGVERIVDILRYVKKEMPDVKLFIVGRGNFGEEKKLEELAGKEGLFDSIIFAGWIQPEDLPRYLSVGDVVIYPFDDTPLNRAKCPSKLVELMAVGKAIVADRVGEIAEYIENGKSGLLVNPYDTMEFAEKVIKVLKDEKLRRKLGEGAQSRIWKNFTWDKLSTRVEKAYKISALQNKIRLNAFLKKTLKKNRYLLSILILSVILRLIWLKMPVHADEGEGGYTAMLWAQGDLPYATRLDVKGPLHYLLFLIPILLFGNDIMPVRMINNVLYFISIVALYLIARSWYNRRVGLFSILFYGIFMSAPALEGSLALASSMTLPFLIFSIYFCDKYLRGNRERKNLIFSGIFIASTLLNQQEQFFGIILLFYMLFTRYKYFIKNVRSLIVDISFFIAGILLPIFITTIYFWNYGALDDLILCQMRVLNTQLPSLSKVSVPFAWTSLTIIEASPIFLLSVFGATICILRFKKADQFLLIWTLIFLFIIKIKSIFFGHYFLSLIPQLSILSSIALNLVLDEHITKIFKDYEQNAANIFTIILLILLFGISIHFQVLQFPNYGMEWEFVGYPFPYCGSYDGQMELVKYLKSHVSKEGGLFIHGWMPEIYWLSGLKAPSIHLSTFWSIPKEEYNRLLKSVERKDFEYVIVAHQPFCNDQIYDAICKNYFYIKKIGERSDIYVQIFSKYNSKGESVVYDFIGEIINSSKEYEMPDGKRGTLEELNDLVVIPKIIKLTINNETRDAILQHPPIAENSSSVIHYANIQLPPNTKLKLSFGIAVHPEVWFKQKSGVLFEVFIKNGERIEKIFHKYIYPKENLEERKWIDYEIDLTRYAGRKISISFITNPTNDNEYDWAVWGNPKIYGILELQD